MISGLSKQQKAIIIKFSSGKIIQIMKKKKKKELKVIYGAHILSKNKDRQRGGLRKKLGGRGRERMKEKCEKEGERG